MPNLLPSLLIETANAQASAVLPVVQFNQNLITPVLLGVAVSLAATLFLMRTGVAAGATAILSKLTGSSDEDSKESKDSDGPDRMYSWAKRTGSGIKTATNLAGFGTAVMAGASLFLGAYLASATIRPTTGTFLVALALFVWAGYTLLANYIQSRVIADTVSPVANFAYGSGKAASSSASRLLSSSDLAQTRKLVRRLTKDIKKEFSGVYADSKLSDQLDAVIKRADSKDADSRMLLTNLAEIINQTEIKLVPSEGSERLVVNTDFSEVKFQGPMVKKALGLGNKAYDSIQDSNNPEDKIKAVASTILSVREEQVQSVIDRVRGVLESTGNEDLSIEELKGAFSDVMENPSEVRSILSSKLDSVSRKDLLAAVSSQTGVSEDKLDRNLSKLVSFFSGSDSSELSLPIGDENSTRLMPVAVSRKLSGLEKTQFSANELEKDIQELVDEPTEFFSIVKRRFSDASREDFKHILQQKTSMENSQIEAYMEKFDNFKSTTGRLKLAAQKNMKDAQLAVKTLSKDVGSAGVSALWWRAGAPLIGAAASIGGAAVAVM